MTSWYKMLKLVTAKRCNTHFVIAERKKNVKTHKKKPEPNVYALNMTIQTEVSSICAKTNCSRSNTETNLASGAHTENFQKKNFFANQNCVFFKTKILTNQKSPKYLLFHGKMASPGPTAQQHPQTQTILATGRKMSCEKVV